MHVNGALPSGGVAFSGYDASFDNCKVGYDVTNDDDINDPTDGERSERSHSATGKANRT